MKVHEYFRMLIIVGLVCLAGCSLVLAEESTNRGGPDSIDWAKPLAQLFHCVRWVILRRGYIGITVVRDFSEHESP